MRIIWTNWKLALLRGRVVLPLTVLFFLALIYVIGEPSLCFAIALLMIPGFSDSQSDIVANPSFFCLPGYRDWLRIMALADAVRGGLVFGAFAVLMFVSDDLTWPVAGWYAFLGYLVGFVCALLGLGSCLLIAAVTPAMRVLLSIHGAVGALIAIGAIVLWPWLIWPVAILICVGGDALAWHGLSDAHLITRAHRMTIEEAMAKRAPARTWRTTPFQAGDWLLRRAKQHRPLGLRRYVWASFYRTFGLVLSYWKWVLAAALVGLLMLVMAPTELAETFAVALGSAAILLDLPATSSMLSSGGRRERYYGTVTAALVVSLLLMMLALLVAGLSVMIAIALGVDTGVLGLRLCTAWLVCVLVPWVCAWQFCRYAPAGIENKTSVLLGGYVVVMVLSSLLDVSRWPVEMRMLAFASFCLLGWVVFLCVLRHVCVCGCLVRRDRRSGG